MTTIPARIFNQTCNIYSRTSTLTGKQAVTPTPTLVASGVKCRTWPLSARERGTIMGNLQDATHRLIIRTPDVPAGFVSGWEVEIGGKRYRVRDTVDAAGKGEMTSVLLEAVR